MPLLFVGTPVTTRWDRSFRTWKGKTALLSCVRRRGVVIAGVGFGLLHNSGGRNLAFAAWASLVGTLFGGAFLYTQDILVPMVAHSFANAAAGVLWRQGQQAKDK